MSLATTKGKNKVTKFSTNINKKSSTVERALVLITIKLSGTGVAL